jgi:hypothetical protein
LRIYTPYLGHARDRLVNFIAVEPIVSGATVRGYSELERSALDDAPGKRFWSADTLAQSAPREPTSPTRGLIETVNDVECLTVWIHSERFDNGAQVAVRVRFRADRPHEVAFAAFATPESAPLEACVVTATMGNYARLRRLHLRDRVVAPAELWPGFSGTQFAEHARFGAESLQSDGERVRVFATPDEPDPTIAEYADDTAEHWKYSGAKAAQGWEVEGPYDDVEVLVNARWAYWASASPIPGGASFENFELLRPFAQGQEATYWVEPYETDAELDRLAP